jgi:hypothetical protein
MRCSFVSALAVALAGLAGLAGCSSDADPAGLYQASYDRLEVARMGGSLYRIDRPSTPLSCGELGAIDVLEPIHNRLYRGYTALIESPAENRKAASLLAPGETCWIRGGPGQVCLLLSDDGTWLPGTVPVSCVVVELEPVKDD